MANKSCFLFFVVVSLFCSVTAAPVLLGQNFWSTPWGDDPFQNTYQNVTGTTPYKAGFIEEISPYHILRFMDYNRTNDHYGETNRVTGCYAKGTSWNDRKQQLDKNQCLLAYEWMIDIANKADCHMWINVPHKADEAYAFELAKLLKDKLNPHLKIFIEFTNELWNNATRRNYCAQRAVELELTDSKTESLQAYTYYAYMSIRIFEQFEKVLGKDSDRIVKIIAGQSGDFTLARRYFKMIYEKTNYPKINPNGTKIDGIAIATYFDPDGTDLATEMSSWILHRNQIAKPYGVNLFFYEGGAEAKPFDGLMTETYKSYLEALETAGFVAGCHYVHSGDNKWASMPQIGVGKTKAMTYPKYKALADYCSKYQKPKSLDFNFKPVPPSNSKISNAKTVSGKIQHVNTFDIRGRMISNRNKNLPNGIYISGDKRTNAVTSKIIVKK